MTKHIRSMNSIDTWFRGFIISIVIVGMAFIFIIACEPSHMRHYNYAYYVSTCSGVVIMGGEVPPTENRYNTIACTHMENGSCVYQADEGAFLILLTHPLELGKTLAEQTHPNTTE